MLAKRIISCLDIKDGQTVKGTNFVNLRQAGDPVELARAYSEQGADELVFLDITASFEGRKTFTELVKRIAANISIPFTVGGGIHELGDVDRLLNAGADKISINSSAIRRPGLIDEIAKNFGSQVCVLAVDAKQTEKGWRCYLNGGRVETDKELFAWTKEAQERGAGEILFTSMNHDGVKTGYANEALSSLADGLSIPIIASGGAGAKEHFRKSRCCPGSQCFSFRRNQNSRIKIVSLCPRNCDEKMKVSLRLDDLRFTIGITQANHKSPVT